MNVKFINTSKSTINIMINSDNLSVMPNHSQTIVSDSDTINIAFCLDTKSILNRFKHFEFQLLSSYVITSVNSEVVIYMNAYKTGGDNWEDYSYVLLSGNTADIRLLSLAVIDKAEIIHEVVENEKIKNEKQKSSKKTGFKIQIAVNTLGCAIPLMFVAFFIAKMFYEIKTVFLILLFIFLLVFLIVFATSCIYEKIAKEYKTKNNPNSNNGCYMLDERYIGQIVFDSKRYRNRL